MPIDVRVSADRGLADGGVEDVARAELLDVSVELDDGRVVDVDADHLLTHAVQHLARPDGGGDGAADGRAEGGP